MIRILIYYWLFSTLVSLLQGQRSEHRIFADFSFEQILFASIITLSAIALCLVNVKVLLSTFDYRL